MDFYKQALVLHKQHHGKIAVASKVPVETSDDLSVAYTPGVAQPCIEIHSNKENAYTYTSKGNLVAVVSDGSAVLGLGNIGAAAAAPVMEGKAVLFKKFGGVDAFPLCIDTQNVEEIIQTVKHIAPCFGGINLEDIASPRCFEIERRLEKELDIPVFHDDQHGTAIVVTAALINALKVVGKQIENVHVVVNGPGAAGTAITKMLAVAGVSHIIAVDLDGILHTGRADCAHGHYKELCEITNPENISGDLSRVLCGADVFIGVSAAGALKPQMIAHMNEQPIVFAMANPEPEIPYAEAIASGVAVMGTGRSDTPNQINNVLAFPGIFRGALDARARDINNNMKLAAAHAIASLVSNEELNSEYVIPSALDPRVARTVAQAVKHAAIESGCARCGE